MTAFHWFQIGLDIVFMIVVFWIVKWHEATHTHLFRIGEEVQKIYGHIIVIQKKFGGEKEN